MSTRFDFEAYDEQPFFFEDEFEDEAEAGRSKRSAKSGRQSFRGGTGNRFGGKKKRRPRPRLPFFGRGGFSPVAVFPGLLTEPGKEPPKQSPGQDSSPSGAPSSSGMPSPQPDSDSPSEGSERIRWVQNTLNQVMNLRLPVDGVIGVETRSAIRSFQGRQGLPVTGFVGPDTERALITASSGQSPGADSTKPTEPIAPPSELDRAKPAAEFDFEWGWGKEKKQEGEANPIAAIDWCQIRQRIASIARAEERRWIRPDGSKFWENQPSRLSILESYWRTVPGFTTSAAALAAARESANDSRAWSAAFICFVMHTAGVRQAHGFEFSQRHITYTVGALRNRQRSDQNRVFWLADQIEVQSEAAPEPGDLLCINRPDENGNMTRHSYERLLQNYWLGGNQNRVPLGASHCSIVVGRVERNGRWFLQTIGGNEGTAGSGNRGVTVGLREIPLDRFGGIPNPQTHNIFGIIKLIGC